MPVQAAGDSGGTGVAVSFGLGDGDYGVAVGDGTTAAEAVASDAGDAVVVAVDIGVGDPVAGGEQPASRSANRIPMTDLGRVVMGISLRPARSRERRT